MPAGTVASGALAGRFYFIQSRAVLMASPWATPGPKVTIWSLLLPTGRRLSEYMCSEYPQRNMNPMSKAGRNMARKYFVRQVRTASRTKSTPTIAGSANRAAIRRFFLSATLVGWPLPSVASCGVILLAYKLQHDLRRGIVNLTSVPFDSG